MSNLIHLNSRQCTAILSFFNPFLRKYIPTIGIDRVEISSLDSGNYEAMKKTLIIMVANTKGGFRCNILINDWLWLNSNQLSINLQADINQMQIKYQANIKQIPSKYKANTKGGLRCNVLINDRLWWNINLLQLTTHEKGLVSGRWKSFLLW